MTRKPQLTKRNSFSSLAGLESMTSALGDGLVESVTSSLNTLSDGLESVTTTLSDGLAAVDQHMASSSSAIPRRSLRQRMSGSGRQLLVQDTTESNIFCSDMMGTDYILARIQQVQESKKITKLEIEDMIASKRHHSILPALENMVFGGSARKWQRIQFVDSMELQDFGLWHAVKCTTMRDYEANYVHLPSSKLNGVFSWKAQVSIPGGTLVEELLKFFKSIKQDPDVVHASLRGANMGAKGSSEDLAPLIVYSQGKGVVLEQEITVDLACGWTKYKGSSSPQQLINCCIYVLTLRAMAVEQPSSNATMSFDGQAGRSLSPKVSERRARRRLSSRRMLEARAATGTDQTIGREELEQWKAEAQAAAAAVHHQSTRRHQPTAVRSIEPMEEQFYRPSPKRAGSERALARKCPSTRGTPKSRSSSLAAARAVHRNSTGSVWGRKSQVGLMEDSSDCSESREVHEFMQKPTEALAVQEFMQGLVEESQGTASTRRRSTSAVRAAPRGSASSRRNTNSDLDRHTFHSVADVAQQLRLDDLLSDSSSESFGSEQEHRQRSKGRGSASERRSRSSSIKAFSPKIATSTTSKKRVKRRSTSAKANTDLDRHTFHTVNDMVQQLGLDDLLSDSSSESFSSERGRQPQARGRGSASERGARSSSTKAFAQKNTKSTTSSQKKRSSSLRAFPRSCDNFLNKKTPKRGRSCSTKQKSVNEAPDFCWEKRKATRSASNSVKSLDRKREPKRHHSGSSPRSVVSKDYGIKETRKARSSLKGLERIDRKSPKRNSGTKTVQSLGSKEDSRSLKKRSTKRRTSTQSLPSLLDSDDDQSDSGSGEASTLITRKKKGRSSSTSALARLPPSRARSDPTVLLQNLQMESLARGGSRRLGLMDLLALRSAVVTAVAVKTGSNHVEDGEEPDYDWELGLHKAEAAPPPPVLLRRASGNSRAA